MLSVRKENVSPSSGAIKPSGGLISCWSSKIAAPVKLAIGASLLISAAIALAISASVFPTI